MQLAKLATGAVIGIASLIPGCIAIRMWNPEMSIAVPLVISALAGLGIFGCTPWRLYLDQNNELVQRLSFTKQSMLEAFAIWVVFNLTGGILFLALALWAGSL